MDRLGPLLGRWHQWRREFSHERRLARVPQHPGQDDEEWKLEQLLMQAIDAEIEGLPKEQQLALQHEARAQCLGIEVMHNPRLQGKDLDQLVHEARKALYRRLVWAGVL